MLEKTGRPLLLRGKVVQRDGTAPDRYLLIRDGHIVSISRQRPPASDDALFVETRSEDWIFPGLLDLHTHATYNLLPLWNAPSRPYDHRFVWRGDDRYKNDVKGMKRHLETLHEGARASGALADVLAVFSDLQAIAGGTTLLQERHSLEQDEPDLAEPVLCRSSANPDDLCLTQRKRSVFSIGDLFKPDDRGRPEPQWTLERYVKDRDADLLQATLVHLAEGRSGFGSEAGPDPYSRLEFETFMAHPAFADAEKVRSSRFAIVHGCGIDVYDERHLAFLKERGISVVWSPVSNLLLYGETIDVERLVAAGINVALGSDWSPSGSKHVWDEAKFARFFFEAIGSPVSDLQVFEMVTVNPARCLGTDRLGRLAPGAAADLFILRSPLETDSALEVFFKATDRHVLAALIGGVPLYGDQDFLAPFDLRFQPLPELEGSAARGKVVHLPAELTGADGRAFDVDREITRLEDLMKAAPEHLSHRMRSNLLSSSDRPYRERIIELRKETIDYGGRVRQWRRDRSRQGTESSTERTLPPQSPE